MGGATDLPPPALGEELFAGKDVCLRPGASPASYPDVERGAGKSTESIIACDCGSTGALAMSTFHQLSAGKTCREDKSSIRTTPSDGNPPDRGAALSQQAAIAKATVIANVARDCLVSRMVKLPVRENQPRPSTTGTANAR
jgi:hypothetical protein